MLQMCSTASTEGSSQALASAVQANKRLQLRTTEVRLHASQMTGSDAQDLSLMTQTVFGTA
jgi:hypothetical protein